jgi:phosphatidylethanolamine/phosphatidyl-N-methylethanolamine N-methyltransferase
MADPQLERNRRNNKLAFLRGFLQYPEQVGSIIPSSRYLEKCLVDIAAFDKARTVVELGPGTGGTTQAILEALPDEAKMLAIELNTDFVSLLSSNSDPRLVVHHGSAERIKEILSLYDLARADVVVSGIPFSTMPDRIGQQILQDIWSILMPGGKFIAYQFRGRVADLGRDIFGIPETRLELFNVPPVRIYNWKKAEALE